MGSLGAIGDSFFWGALRPMASVAGALLALLHPLLGIAAMLLLYNGVHLMLRRRGFAAGMEGPEAVVGWLKRAALNVRTDDRKLLAAILAGAYAGVFAGRFFVQGGARPTRWCRSCSPPPPCTCSLSCSGRRSRRRRS